MDTMKEFKTVNIKERIDEIISLSQKNNLSESFVEKLTDKSFDEPKLHAIVWMLRENIPEDLMEMVVNIGYNYDDTLKIINYYHSDEIDNRILYKAIEMQHLQAIDNIKDAIDFKRARFQTELLENRLFSDNNAVNLLKTNETVYIKHEFNWKTYRSKLVLYGANEKLTFYMPQIPLTGGCFSNFVAQRMLMGQMYLQFVFNAAKSSLEYIKERYNLDCKIVACDNCFYAPYLMTYRDENGKMIEGIEENAKKTYMEYLMKEYPKAYKWLQNRKENENFYEEFYTKHIPT